MFVGGLSWQTTPGNSEFLTNMMPLNFHLTMFIDVSESLRAYFSKFGDLNECLVVKDPTTKRAR